MNMYFGKISEEATYNGSPLFEAEMGIWVRGKMAMCEAVQFILLDPDFFLIIER